LVITQGQLGLTISFRADGEKHEFEFEKGKITIGRRKDCDVVIQNSSVSRLHATVKLEKGRWVLRDNGSANGLAVRGELLKSHPLSDDRIMMGDVAVHFQIKLPVDIGGNVLHSEQKLSSSISVDNLDTLLETMLGDAPTKDRDTTQLGIREPTSLNAADIILIMRAATDAFLAHDDLDSILNQVLDLIFEHLPVNQASVLLLDHQTSNRRRRSASADISRTKLSLRRRRCSSWTRSRTLASTRRRASCPSGSARPWPRRCATRARSPA